MPVWINNSRIGRYLANLLGNQTERLNFAISKLISVVVPIDLVAGEIQTLEASFAGNASWNITPGKGHRLRLLYGMIYLDNDATSANRVIQVHVLKSDASTWICYFVKTNSLTADQNNYLVLNQTGSFTSVGVQEGTGTYGMNYMLDVYDTDILQITVVNGVAGDAVTARLKVQWM